MERLTKRDTDGQAMMDCEKCKADWTGKHGKPMVDCTALYCRNRLKDRLAAYEDLRLTPEEITAMQHTLDEYHKVADPLLRAQADGRLVVLPCKVGDTVYKVITIQAQKPVLLETQVKTLGQAADVAQLIGKKNKVINIFLTREEAEAALEAMKDE